MLHKKAILVFIFLFTAKLCFGQLKLDTMIVDLKESDFLKIYKVISPIISCQKNAIPKLIELLQDTSYFKLKNTADLMYPGADEFYGHGWSVNYDIDWISVRAGWLLENLTFQNFGYNVFVTKQKLMEIRQEDYEAYLAKGFVDINMRDTTPIAKLKIYHSKLADYVSKWWNQNKAEWTRLGALEEALASSDEIRQSKAIDFLRSWETTCDNLNVESYRIKLKPLLKKIAENKSDESEQAYNLIKADETYWIKKLHPSQ